MTELEAAWAAIDAATPAGWPVGRPSRRDERSQWMMYAFHPSERPEMGARSREWTAGAQTELDVVRQMARCLREIRAGRAPK
jgi:hypothetical protein